MERIMTELEKQSLARWLTTSPNVYEDEEEDISRWEEELMREDSLDIPEEPDYLKDIPFFE